MGLTTEQTTEVLDSAARLVEAATPDVAPSPDPNYWWLLAIGVIPVFLAFFLNRKKTLSKGKKP